MDEIKLLYKSLTKKRKIKYSYKTTQFMELILNNLNNEQQLLFFELIDRIKQEQHEAQYKWYLKGINTAKKFIR